MAPARPPAARLPAGACCDGCGRPVSECGGCRRPLDPPRHCRRCGGRLRVLVTPAGYAATCRACGPAPSAAPGADPG